MDRWGRFVARHRWWFVVGWIAVLVGAAVLYPSFVAHQTATDYSVQGSESRRVDMLVRDEFPQLAGEQDVVVFEDTDGRIDDPADQQRIAQMLQTVAARPDVAEVVPPSAGSGQVSSDRTAAIALVTVRGDPSRAAGEIQDGLDHASAGSGLHAYLVGETPISDAVIDSEYASAETAEAIGVPIAFVICLLATGALVAALLPIGLGIVTVTLAFGVLGAVGNLVTLDGILSSVVPMIGLGVGIDYALFVTSRFREELRPACENRRPTRLQVDHAVGAAVASAGLTVAFSGVVVMLSLLSLVLIPARTFQQLAVGMSLTVGCALLAGLTLLPAILAVLGHRVERGGLPWRRRVVLPGGSEGRGLLGRLARALMRRPVAAAAVAVVALLIIASPALGLRLGLDMGIEGLGDAPAAQGQRVLASKFSPGALMPIQVVYTAPGDRLTEDDIAVIDRLSQRIGKDDLVSGVVSITTPGTPPAGRPGDELSGPLVSADGRHTHLSVIPAVAPDDRRAAELVERIRGDLSAPAEHEGGQVRVGGVSAQYHDLSQVTADRFWIVVSAVLVLSFFLLTLVFRSLLLPLKAIAMNLLATVASYGALVWVFQQGHLAELFDFVPKGTIQAFLPLVLFALLFGLSMDYEIFLVRRIQEEWRRTGDNTHAVAVGLEHTGLQITAAAGIMVAVFGAFVTGSVLELKQIGFGLAFAVLIDATIVRLILVPALMRLAGRWNWWLPRWLDRLLPRLDLD